ncbi:MAG TPA: AAA family ATPase [Caulobacteraceae bacterium]
MSPPEATAGRILILTGPPGSGKSTIARALAAEGPGPRVWLHADDFWAAIRSGAIEPWRAEAHGQNAVVMSALASAAGAFAAGGYLVIVDGIVGPWFLDPFLKLATPLSYVVLRPSASVALERAKARAKGLAASGPILGLHRQFSLLGDLERCVIDTTLQTPAETVKAVRCAFGSQAFRLGDL